MALLEGFLPIEIKEADNIEVNFNQTEQEVEIKLTKNGETISTKVIKLTNSKLKKFWVGVSEGPIINIGSDYVGIQEQDFYYNFETNQLYIVISVNTEEETDEEGYFTVVKVDHKYSKPIDPPASYQDDDFIYKQGDIWINNISNNVWILASISGEGPESTYNWTPIGVSGSSTNNYELLINKPTLNEQELVGNLTSNDLNIPTFQDINKKQDKLTPGANITIQDGVISANDAEPLEISYNKLLNKPSINNISLQGNVSSESLGLATVESVSLKQDQLTPGQYIEIEDNVVSVVLPNQIVSRTIAPPTNKSEAEVFKPGDIWLNTTSNTVHILLKEDSTTYTWKEL